MKANFRYPLLYVVMSTIAAILSASAFAVVGATILKPPFRFRLDAVAIDVVVFIPVILLLLILVALNLLSSIIGIRMTVRSQDSSLHALTDINSIIYRLLLSLDLALGLVFASLLVSLVLVFE